MNKLSIMRMSCFSIKKIKCYKGLSLIHKHRCGLAPANAQSRLNVITVYGKSQRLYPYQKPKPIVPNTPL